MMKSQRHHLSVLLLLTAACSDGASSTIAAGKGCTTSVPCPSGYECVAGIDGKSACEALSGCSTNDECANGRVCYNNTCATICTDDGACAPAEQCTDGYCVAVDQPACTSNAECTTPAPCESSVGAYCEAGTCHYAAYVCRQAGDVDVCVEVDGSCNPSITGCAGETCCVFAPTWPVGSTAPQPPCPFAGEDPEGDGVRGVSEVWSGTCSHEGLCVGCTSRSDCDDGNACTLDDCAGSICTYDSVSKLGVACAVVVSGDGVCVADGAGITCKLDVGSNCGADMACASGLCGCADDGCATRVCHEVTCALCQYSADGVSTCVPTSAGKRGQGCTGAAEACSATADCLLANGQTCFADAECGSGNCECVDAACSAMMCSEVPCPCGSNATGDAACDANLIDGTNDPEDCVTPESCYGGVCRHVDGTACSAPGACLSGNCVDGVCCDTACAGDCGVCNSPGFEGTCLGQDAACASGCGYCAAVAADAFTCTCDLVYAAHSHVQCTAAGGTVVSSAGASFCRFNVAACPGGWTQYLGWSTTAAAAATYYNEVTIVASSGGCCGADLCNGVAGATCASGGHAWSDNSALESSTCVGTEKTGKTGTGSCDNGTCTGTVACAGATSVTATATRTQIGCY